MNNFAFNILYQNPNSKMRLGELHTPHGVVQTPAFIFCATKAAIKSLHPQQMKEEGTQFILANTYHLMLQPGPEIVEKAGGLHKFMGWNGPMLTDSGGFQIFSLGHGSVASEIKGKRSNNFPKTLLKITEEGAKFRSYIDGRTYFLTPERSIEIQRMLGPDFVVVLDECTPFHVDKRYTHNSMKMSHRWASRSLLEFSKHDNGAQKLYGIIQGGVYPDLRKESCDYVNSQPFFGHAVGGSLGADKSQMYDVVAITMELLDRVRPVHLLGIGGIADVFNGVEQGIDTFDCVHPTRLARHGGALVRPEHRVNPDKEHLNLNNSRYREDFSPIEPDCPCYTCKNHTKAYLHHLLHAKELIAASLLTIHNVNFMNRMMNSIREAIRTNSLVSEKKRWISYTMSHS
jgi:queuine tRNA-ribosyltransferase